MKDLNNVTLEALIKELGIETLSEDDVRRQLGLLVQKFDAKYGLKTAAEIDQAVRDRKVPCCNLVDDWNGWSALLSTYEDITS